MDEANLAQRSAEWHLARLGSVGASRIADLTARTKTGYGASRSNLMAELIAERLTGVPTETFVNSAMQHGTDTEPEARRSYEFFRDVEVKQVGLIRHPTISGAHASPDGLIGDDGMLELKCPTTNTHLQILLGQAFADRYLKQALWQLACSGRSWVDLASYDNRLPAEMQLFIHRVHRDDVAIAALEKEVSTFLSELDEKIANLRHLYGSQTNILAAG